MAAWEGSVFLFSSLWSEKNWLPENVTWADIKVLRNPKFSELGGLYLAFPVAILLIFVRIFFERFIARPFMCYLGVVDKKIVIEANPLCEKVYRTDGHSPGKDEVEHLSQQLGWSAKQVQRWFRRRRNSSKESVLNKATASSWRFMFYLTATICGFLVLHKEPFFWDLKHCYIGFPSQHVLTDDMFYYYLLELAFYMSMTVLQFLEEKKKDFWQMVLHHLITVYMIAISYMVGYVRIGAVIMWVHDIADVFLELAKVLNYAKMQKLCDGVFVIFTVTFYLTRLLYFPFWVLHAQWFISPSIVGTYARWYMDVALLSTLQGLHLYWGFLISKMVYQFTVVGKVAKDERSDEDHSSGAEEKEREEVLRNGAPSERKKSR